MVFEFRAHKPGAYGWFAFLLIVTVFLNELLIQWLHPLLLNWNDWVQHSVVFIVPWILFLFLPSVFSGLLIYSSLSKKYGFIVNESELETHLVNQKGQPVPPLRKHKWSEVKSFRFSDFEDNHYFTLVFADKKNNLVIHRDTGPFEPFFEEIKKYVQH